MTYSFLQDLEDLQKFYEAMSVNNDNVITFATTPTISRNISSEGVNDIQREVDFNKNYLLKIIPILQCSAWDNFVKRLEKNEPSRFLTHFPNGLEKGRKWYSDSIKEIALLRNCIVHNKGVVDELYVKYSSVQKYALGDLVIILEQDVPIFFKEFEAGYKLILA